MSDFKEKIKEKLLLTQEDIPLLLNGNFKELHAQNKDAALRVMMAYALLTLGLVFYLFIFSLLGVLGKLIFCVLFFSVLALIGFKIGKESLMELSQFPAISYFVTFFFGLMTWNLFSDVFSQGGFLANSFLFLCLAGLGGGIFVTRSKAKEKEITKVQTAIVALILTSLLLSFQAVILQHSVLARNEAVKRYSDARREREAKELRASQSSLRACTSEEECKKMNSKKDEYYETHRENAQEACEIAVSKQISGRFEWTVSLKDYKFSSYQVNALKDTIYLFGNSARLIKAGNIRQDINYSCEYNTKTLSTDVKIMPVAQ